MFRNRGFKFYHQLESIDCGPACLAMVADKFSKCYSVKELKEFCSITRMGVSVQDLINGAAKIGLEASAAKLSLDQLEEIPLPTILFWKQDHFVVLHKIDNNKKRKLYHVADPAYGKVKLESDTLISAWMHTNPQGIAIIIQEGEKNEGLQGKKAFSKPNYDFLRQIKIFVTQNKLKYTFSLLLLLTGLVANWALPVIFQKTIDKGIIGKSIHIIWVMLFAQFGLFFGNFVSQFVSDLILTKLNFRLSILLKESMLYKLMKLPISYYDTRLNSDTLQRLGDQNKIQSFITWKGFNLVLNFLNIVIFSAILFTLNKYIFLVFFVLSALSVVWVSFFLKRRAGLEYSLFFRQSENNNSLYEFVMNMPEIKINTAQGTAINRIITIQRRLHDIELKSLFLNMYQLLGTNFFSKLKELAAIALGAYLILNDSMTIGTLLSISFILGQLNGPLLNFVNNIRDAQDANIAHKRINDIYNEKNENENDKLALPDTINRVQINRVTFKYPGSFNPFVLKNISFDICKNKKTAIVGTSGSGKTTLMKLLLSYYKPDEGNVLINEVPLDQFNSDEWRKLCGTVLQDGHIFAGTIAQNIAFSDQEIDNDKLLNAAKIACIDQFVLTLPMGFNTKVGNVGIQLSGGQKQRLLIARAVYKNPQFLFFDEATSSLDANNEKEIMDNLNQFFIGKTVIIIAHRLSTVKSADQIIVLNKGEIVEIGNHEMLINKKGNYFQLVKNQLELGN